MDNQGRVSLREAAEKNGLTHAHVRLLILKQIDANQQMLAWITDLLQERRQLIENINSLVKRLAEKNIRQD